MKAKERLHQCQEELKKEREKNKHANMEILRVHDLMKATNAKARRGALECAEIVHAIYTDCALRFGTEAEDGYKEITMQMLKTDELKKFEILTARSEDGTLTVRVREKETNHGSESSKA